MLWLRVLFCRILGILHRARLDRELEDELLSHIEFATDEYLRRGMPLDEARAAAILGFGDLEQTKKQYRALRGLPPIETAIVDGLSAVRELRHAPRFTLVCVATLALGIGTTATLLTLGYAFLFKPLPVYHPNELYRVGDRHNCCVVTGLQDDWSLFSYALYKAFLKLDPQELQLAAFQAEPNTVSVRQENRPLIPLGSEFVSSNYFAVLGVAAYRGRLFVNNASEERTSLEAVLSYRAWDHDFHHDPSIIGTAVEINGNNVTIAGVTPPEFFGDRLTINPPAIWLLLEDEPVLDITNSKLRHSEIHWLYLIGRLSPATRPERIAQRMQSGLRTWLDSDASKLPPTDTQLINFQELHLAPGGHGVPAIQPDYQHGLFLVVGISFLFFLIAGANATNLVLARSSLRFQLATEAVQNTPDIPRMLRRSLYESIAVTILGGIFGLLISFLGVHAVLSTSFAGVYLPLFVTGAIQISVVILTGAMSLFLILGSSPARNYLREPLRQKISRKRLGTHQQVSATRRFLTAFQASLCFGALCGALIAHQDLSAIRHDDLGFNPSNRYVAHIDLRSMGSRTGPLSIVYSRVLDTVRRIPGVRNISYSLYGPMDGVNPNLTVYVAGQPTPPPNSNRNNASWNRVSDGFFHTIGMKIVAGRGFKSLDSGSVQQVAIVNETFAKRFFPGKNPLGGFFGTSSSKSDEFRIVGVVHDAQYQHPSAAVHPTYFLSASQTPATDAHLLDTFVIEVSRTQKGQINIIREAIENADRNLSVVDIDPLDQKISESLREETMVANLVSLLGVLAICCGAVGLYEISSYFVYQCYDLKTSFAVPDAEGGLNRVVRLIFQEIVGRVLLGILATVPVILIAEGTIAKAAASAEYALRAIGQSAFVLLVVACSAVLLSAWQADHRAT